MGPRKVSGDFLGLAPVLAGVSTASMAARSKGDDDEPLAPSVAASPAGAARVVSKSKPSMSGDAGDQGSLDDAAVRAGGCGLHGSLTGTSNNNNNQGSCFDVLVDFARYSRIRLHHPRDISSSRSYWPFSTGTEF